MILFKKRSWKANKRLRDKVTVDMTLHLFFMPSCVSAACVGENECILKQQHALAS